MTTLGPTYDPVSTATALADKYIAGSQSKLTDRMKANTAEQTALSSLSTAISSFQSSLSALTGLNRTMFSQMATVSDTSLGSATASASAAPGTYSFFVQQVATAHQLAFDNVPTSPAAGGGTLKVNFGTGAPYNDQFTVDLASADSDHNGTLTVREIAAAINGAADNEGQVSASVITVGSAQQLVLSSKNTGVANSVSLDTSAVADTGLKTALDTSRELVAAKDAIIWLGAQTTGTMVTQSSNTFTNIDGVKLTVSKAQANGSPAATVTVGTDTAATVKNVQDFIDAYNKLSSVLDGLLYAGDPEKNKASGAFVHDASIRALRSRLTDMLRPVGATSLAAYGITASKTGALTLDAVRLNKKIASDPAGLDALIGSTAAGARSGIADRLDNYLNSWSDSTSGTLTKRADALEDAKDDMDERQELLDSQYNTIYQRYLKQFSKLQQLQTIMSNNSSMFDALFSNDKSK